MALAGRLDTPQSIVEAGNIPTSLVADDGRCLVGSFRPLGAENGRLLLAIDRALRGPGGWHESPRMPAPAAGSGFPPLGGSVNSKSPSKDGTLIGMKALKPSRDNASKSAGERVDNLCGGCSFGVAGGDRPCFPSGLPAAITGASCEKAMSWRNASNSSGLKGRMCEPKRLQMLGKHTSNKKPYAVASKR